MASPAATLQALIVATTDPGTLESATAELLEFLGQPTVIPILFDLLTSTLLPVARRGALIYLHQAIANYWPSLDADSRSAIKQSLVGLMSAEFSVDDTCIVADVVSQVYELDELGLGELIGIVLE